MTNCLMIIPLPKGCITVLEKDSFSHKGAKHCARPQDMSGQSGALVMRHIPKDIMDKARSFSQVAAKAQCEHRWHSGSGKSVKIK